MIRARRAIGMLAVVCAVTSVTAAAAQNPPPQGRAGRGQQQAGPPNVTPNMTVPEVERMFDAWELMHAKAPLQLDDQTFLTFMPRFQQVLFVQRQHQAARQRHIGELNALMKAGVVTDDATLAAKTKSLDDLEAQHLQDFGKVMGAVDQVLTVKQRARLRVFMNNMERQKLDLIAQARQQANKGTGGSGPAPAAPPAKIIK